MRAFIIVIGLCLLVSNAIGQATGHDHEPLATFGPAPAQYALSAKVDAAQSRVIVWADLSFTNTSNQDIQNILFGIPKGDAISLDSILLFGTPLDTSRIRIDEHTLTLTVPVKAREMVPLQFSFTTHLAGLKELSEENGMILADDWYPRVATPSSSERELIPEIGDFRLEITVDTPLQITAPGTWVNEIEYIGSIPERADSIFVDLSGQSVKRGPQNQHYYRLTGAERLTFAVMRGAPMARIQFDQQRIDLYGAANEKSKERATFLTEASTIAREVVRRMGTLPDGRFVAVFGRKALRKNTPERFGYVSLASRDPERMLAELTHQFASQYFNRAGESSTELAWSDGAAVYLTAVILHSLYPQTGYEMVHEWLEDRLPPREIRQPLGRSPFAWMETIRRPNRPLSPEDSILFKNLFVAPSALQILAAGTSDEAVGALLRRYSLEVRHRHAAPDEFNEMISEELGERWVTRLDQFRQDRKTYDWSVQGVSFDKTDDGFVVRVDINASALANMPVELTLINGSDTAMALHTPPDSSGSSATFLQEMPFRPSTIILDPLHKLPDNNRQNNVYISGRSGGKYQSTQIDFPTFKRLTRGD